MAAPRREREAAAASSADAVALWSSRARAYEELTRRWTIFTRLADRLVDAVEADPAIRVEGGATVLDVGAGAGLSSQRLLRRVKVRRLVLVEPAAALCQLAELSLSRVEGRSPRTTELVSVAARVEELSPRGWGADAALSSAAWHLVEDAGGFAGVAASLRAGGLFALNLWWHAWADIAARAPALVWRRELESVLQELDAAPPALPVAARPSPRERSSTLRAARRAGLDLVAEHVDEDSVEERFFLEFAAMDDAFLGALGSELRAEALARASERLTDSVVVVTQRLVFRKL